MEMVLARQIRGLQAVAAGQRMDGGSAFRRFGRVERHRHVFDGAGLGVQDNGHGDIPRALVVQQLGIALLRVVIGQEESNLAAGRDLEIAHFQMQAVQLQRRLMPCRMLVPESLKPK